MGLLASLVACVALLNGLLNPAPVVSPAPVVVDAGVPLKDAGSPVVLKDAGTGTGQAQLDAGTGWGQFTHAVGKSAACGQSWFLDSWTREAVFVPGTDFTKATPPYERYINPAYVADVKLYGGSTFRTMDAGATNSNPVITWAQRRLPTNSKQLAYGANDASPHEDGIALEYRIALANAANVDLWVNMPHLADDDYFRQAALLIKSQLHSNLRVYVEFSNEVNLGQWQQTQWLYTAGPAQGLPGSNKYYQATALALKRTLDMSKQFSDVFGGDMGSRTLIVVASTGNLDLTAQAFATVYSSSKWNPTNQKVHLFAVAPYFSSPSNDGAQFNLIAVKAQIDALAAGEPIGTAKSIAAKYGIPFVGIYEFGIADYTNSSSSALSATMADAYTYAFNKFAPLLNGPMCAYTLHSEIDGAKAWGATDNTGADCSKFPKCRAIRDWIAAHPN